MLTPDLFDQRNWQHALMAFTHILHSSTLAVCSLLLLFVPMPSGVCVPDSFLKITIPLFCYFHSHGLKQTSGVFRAFPSEPLPRAVLP